MRISFPVLLRVFKMLRCWLISALLLCALTASAHEPTKSYLSLGLGTNQLIGQWDIPLHELQAVIPLDSDNDGFVTWDELNARYKEVTAYAAAHLKIDADARPGTVRFTDTEPAVEDFTDGTYVQLPFVIDGIGAPRMLELDYRLFFEVNSQHRGLLRLEFQDKTQSAIFSPDQTTQRFEVGQPYPGKQFLLFLKEGIWHIWTGYDHILFLLALLLPAVLQCEAGNWRGVAAFRPACFNVLKIVTAFTVAHSLTLSLAALNIVKLPPRLTESAIALSVVLAATNNIVPWIRQNGWLVAFAFGLIHGFGFANALSELGLTKSTLALTLVGFNLGSKPANSSLLPFFCRSPISCAAPGFIKTPCCASAPP